MRNSLFNLHISYFSLSQLDWNSATTLHHLHLPKFGQQRGGECPDRTESARLEFGHISAGTSGKSRPRIDAPHIQRGDKQTPAHFVEVSKSETFLEGYHVVSVISELDEARRLAYGGLGIGEE